MSAQSVGVELGMAGIENCKPVTPAGGVTLQMPVLERLSVSATYVRWTGRDGNDAFLAPRVSRVGYGNQALLVTGLVRLSDPEGVSASIGAGAGWFQHFSVIDGQQKTVYDGTPVGVLYIQFRLSRRLNPYVRVDVQIPTEPALHYGLVRLGLDIQLR